VAIEKHTETLFRLNRCPVTHVVEDRVQLPPLLRDGLFCSARYGDAGCLPVW
jgi:hypothetical protein